MKNLYKLIILALAFSFSIATAQTAPGKQWDARFGGSDNDYFTSLQQTADGGYILGGSSSSGISGDKTQASQGSSDYWIVKTDAQGVKQWEAQFGGSDNEALLSLQQTADGGYLLGGSSSSGISGDKTQGNWGDWNTYDYWIVKTDESGVKQWDARFGGIENDWLYSLQQTSDGGYILGGYSYSGISGDKTQESQSGSDYWIVKTDATGVKQWDARFGGNHHDDLKSLQQTADGGFILGGQSKSGISGDKTQAKQGVDDYWIVKTDATGVKQWDAVFGGSKDDYLYTLQQTTDGGYILGGSSYSGISGDITQASQGGNDYWIVKTDAGGVKQWDARFGGSNADGLYSLQQTADGGYILGGYSNSGIGGDKTQASQGGYDYWIVKTDATGVKQWDARFGGSEDDYFYSLQQTADGEYILGGYSNSGISGDKTQASQGYSDFWIVKIGASGCSPCPLPQSVDISNLTISTATVNWTGNDCAAGYRIRKRPVGTSTWIYTSVAAPTTSKTLQNNLEGTGYEVQVQTFCNAEKTDSSGYTASVYFFTPCSSCPLPQAVFISNITATTADVNWTGNSCAASYRIRKRPVGTSTWIYSSVTAPTTLKTLQNNLEGTTYEVQVQTYCNTEKTDSSGYTSSVNFTSPVICNGVNGAATADITATSANLNWTYSASPTKWIINYRPLSSSTWISVTIDGSNSNYQLSGLTSSTSYKWKIRAKCGSIKSNWSAVQNFKTTALKLSDQNTLSEDVLIYPNPNHGSFSITIKHGADSDVTIDVLNVLGQVVQHISKQTINNKSIKQINLESTAAGVYFIKIQQDNETIVKKVVVEK